MLHDLQQHEMAGTTRTPRHAAVRFRAGPQCGELFAEGVEFDGLTLTIEISGYADAEAMLQAIRLSPLDQLRHAVLSAIPSADYYVSLRAVAEDSGLPAEICRAIIAGLRADGLADYQRGLFDEDGQPCGSGYAITLAGIDWLRRNGEAAS